MKKVNNFQIAKLLANFSLALLIKMLLIKKKRVFIFNLERLSKLTEFFHYILSA